MDSASLTQTIVSASMPWVVSGAFGSQAVYSAYSSLEMGIESTNTNGLLGISQQLGDKLGFIPSYSSSIMTTDSQGVVLQSTQIGSQPSGDTPGVKLAGIF